MNKILPLLLLLSCKCFAQKEANIWYFGNQAGVDFNSGTPVALTNCSTSFNAFEGVGTLSDANGNLLFYTDGNNVFNANHVAMPNGTGLLSNISSTQTGLSIKQPGNSSIYYLFHIDLGYSGITLYYSTVDMLLDGGLGDVVQQNILLRNNTTEKVTGVVHANGTDVWIITHDMSSSAFVAFLLTSSGLSATPVISNTGPVYTNEIGYLKASPQGNMLASADFYMNTYSLYDFDNATGIVSNGNSSPANYVYAYGCEWSPGGTKLYGGMENSNDLWQFDVSAGPNVWNTATLIYETSSQEYEALQLGPDGKIYTSRYQTAWLGVVNDPDSAGSACNYVDNGVNLQGRVCYLGLPNYNMSIFNPQQLPAFASTDTQVCQKFCISFFDSSLNNPTSWQWIFPGGSPSSSTVQNPANICYNSPGTYDVTLITTNASGNDTLTLPDYITVNPTPPIPTITQVGYTLTSSTADFYQWQYNSTDIPGATDQSYTVLESGLYTVVVSDLNGCQNSISIKIFLSGIVGVADDPNISIYPTPSSGSFMIELLNCLTAGEVSIDIVNTLGQQVFSSSEKISSADWKKGIDLHHTARGVYFIEIRSEKVFLREKIIITN